ncbi:mast cell protease 1A-like [Myripristis murdjan]|uniref:mast cell protease 1A-like n=1 Tax=Myripristis murdjan TaxID=586833 RepID=UPI00117604E8|nr:mast cell protease 1A-like [Myripristis murdjan]
MPSFNIVLLFCVLICLGQEGLGNEIIHGKKAKKKTLLYMASVQSKGKHKCGGFLINEEFVVTAAHCDMKNMTVVLGTHDLRRVDDKTMRYRVQKCKHPSYNDDTLENDIMLLKLSRKAELSKTMATIPIPSKSTYIKAKTKCRVAGRGISKPGSRETVDELRVVDVSTIDLKVCEKEWRIIPANVICAGGYKTKKGFCQGDSGGPLVCKGEAVGIVSFNEKNNCTYPSLPNVYTEISKFLPWVNDILQKKSC